MEGLFDNAERLDASRYVHKHVLDLHNMPLMTRELAQRMAVAVVSSMHKHDCFCGCCMTVSVFAIDLILKIFDTILGRQLCGNLDPISFSTTSFPPALADKSFAFTSGVLPKIVARLNVLPKQLVWAPQSHTVYHEDQRLAIRNLLLCWSHLQGQPQTLGCVPVEIMFMIYERVCRPPYVFHRRCHGCSKLSPDLKRCGSCKQVLYCSRECQKKSYSEHSKPCTAYLEKYSDVKSKKQKPDFMNVLMGQLMNQLGVKPIARADKIYRKRVVLFYGEPTNFLKELQKK